ncbi:hypothetical protein LEP1GSC199_2547 [Leptospira vanthielii serovar Holland str. Waz Holland = ATCC 700522]|uniref:Uncharacterized protein n=1 Tax=Leptospira vanthielii serovar Holland str. Waz Holland = ATCC 700522 TaxID=1218591 RepID=N1W1I8_9LEPT|nr:hypothetical protein LEP1GSC199_2547 [Leptospira vanthielii serovar Holland str. Waz Holland = ATCC 700522]
MERNREKWEFIAVKKKRWTNCGKSNYLKRSFGKKQDFLRCQR